MKNTFHCCFNYQEKDGKACPTISTDFDIELLTREEAVNFYFCLERCMDMLNAMFDICTDNGGFDNIYEI